MGDWSRTERRIGIRGQDRNSCSSRRRSSGPDPEWILECRLSGLRGRVAAERPGALGEDAFELGRIERLDEVVVEARGARAALVVGLAPSGEREEREEGGILLLLAQRLRGLVAVHARHADVE